MLKDADHTHMLQAPQDHTWSNYNVTKLAVSDYFFHSSAACLTAVAAFYYIDQCCALSIHSFVAMPPLEVLRCPLLQNMKHLRDLESVGICTVIKSAIPADKDYPYLQLQQTKTSIMHCNLSCIPADIIDPFLQLQQHTNKLRMGQPYYSSLYFSSLII